MSARLKSNATVITPLMVSDWELVYLVVIYGVYTAEWWTGMSTGGTRHKQGFVVRLAEGGAKDVVGGGGGGGKAERAWAQQVRGQQTVQEVQGEAETVVPTIHNKTR